MILIILDLLFGVIVAVASIASQILKLNIKPLLILGIFLLVVGIYMIGLRPYISRTVANNYFEQIVSDLDNNGGEWLRNLDQSDVIFYSTPKDIRDQVDELKAELGSKKLSEDYELVDVIVGRDSGGRSSRGSDYYSYFLEQINQEGDKVLIYIELKILKFNPTRIILIRIIE